MYNSQLNPPKTTKNMTRYGGYGIVFGTLFGVLLGNYYKYQVPPIILGIIICMGLGFILGKKKDKKVNEQLESHAYAVKESAYDSKNNTYKVIIVDKKGQEKNISMDPKKYKSMELKKTELVFLNKNDQITKVYSETREKKHNALLDISKNYQKIKREKEASRNNDSLLDHNEK
ncbi:MAG: hypothetical protein ACTIH2_04365 [Anaerococcus sp.]